MVLSPNIPARFAERAERRRWFTRADAEGLLDWIEDCGHRFLGIEVAERGPGGTLILLEDALELARQTDNFEAVRRGRVFLAENDGEARVFEPIWQDFRT